MDVLPYRCTTTLAKILNQTYICFHHQPGGGEIIIHFSQNYVQTRIIPFNLMFVPCIILGRVAQSVQRLATGWTFRGSNPVGGEIFRTSPDRQWGPPSLLYNGYRVFPRVKRPGRCVDHPPFLAPRSRMSRTIPLLSL
jgi:hypothetical protein